ncbi:Uncharacterised protein [Macrococcoides caseolyticum]|nr:TniQ family protein [Macrococcus caseolyticus]STY78274.1 Uncharacterised protein [Macrococcus caseolyticus]
MLPFFINPYPNELLYSAIARYHFYSGNLDCKDTLEELFGSRCVIPSVEIGSYFSVLVEKLGPHYSVESLLANHTIYPYYASFFIESAATGNFTGCIKRWTSIIYEEELGNLNLYNQLYPERGNKFKVLKIIHLRLHLLYEEA